MKELMQISTQTNQNIEKLQQTTSNTNVDLWKTYENLTQLWITSKEVLEKAEENVNQKIKDIWQWNFNNSFKVSAEESIKNIRLNRKNRDIATRNEDLQNRSMRSTLNFLGLPESEKNDSWEEVSQNLVGLLEARLNLDCYELNMKISNAHRTPKSEDNNNCWSIFAQFVSWRYADEVRRKLI